METAPYGRTSSSPGALEARPYEVDGNLVAARGVDGGLGAARDDFPLDYYDLGAYDAHRQAMRRRGLWGVVALCIAAVLVFFGMLIWEQVRPPSIESYATQEITIKGLAVEDFTITPQDLLALECVWTKESAQSGASSTTGTTTTVSADVYGPRLETFLANYGYEIDDFTKIKATCSADGHYSIIRPQRLEGEVIMSIANGKQALYEKQQPLRFIVTGEASSNWTYGVDVIEFTKKKNVL